ncbi:MAG: hypothetical protein PHP53_15285 [Prolixibacteraceae bacterium]|nr:hypothetical protein [Prolixibacteraceae bacterium]
MKKHIDPIFLIIAAVASVVILSFFSLPIVIVALTLIASFTGGLLLGGKNESIIGYALGGSIPVWIAIYLSFELEDVPQAIIRIYIICLLCLVGLVALVKIWIQRVQEQKEIELANQREQAWKQRRQEMEQREQNGILQLQELTQRVQAEKKIHKDQYNEIKEPIEEYKSVSTQVAISTEVIQAKSSQKLKEILPPAVSKEPTVSVKRLFVNYHLDLPECTESYAVLRIPPKDCIIRSHRYGKTKRRGFKEEAFQQVIEKYFNADFLVSGNLRLNTGKETRPFEPDIALVEHSQEFNIRINIEIDEPYAGLTRQPTHCKGDDLMRDTYFVDRGWMVIRFSEYQVHTQELSCIRYVAQILNKISPKYKIPSDLLAVSELISEKMWDIVQAQKWEKQRYRENYLNHVFGEVEEKAEVIERDFNQQEIDEESQVAPSINSIPEGGKQIGFNKINAHQRDKRIVFYPDIHLYTVDNAPMPSASSVISRFFPEFDAEYWSYRKAPELGMTPEEVAVMWKSKGEKAALEGTYLHEQIENYYLGIDYHRTPEFHLFEKFINYHKTIEPYRTEWRIFDEDYNIAGTIDLISKNGNGIEIYDWKRSKKVINSLTGNPITDNPWQSGVGALTDIPDTSYNRYCLQQSMYRYILERKYDLNISKMYLVVIYPEYETYHKVEVPYWKERVKYILNSLK